MIKLLEEITRDNLNEIVNFCETGCLGVRSMGSLLSYGIEYDFATFWEQRDYSGNLTAFISKVYGNTAVYASEGAEIDEIKEFLRVIGYTSLISDKRITGDQPGGYIMVLDHGMQCKAKPTELPHKFIQNDNLKSFFDAINVNIPSLMPSVYEEWLVDVSHRIRYKTAVTLIATAPDDPNIVYSTASALAITPACALLGAISTNEEYRGKHFAYSCIENLCNKFFDKKIYLMCKPDKVDFYEGAGFRVDGEFAIV